MTTPLRPPHTEFRPLRAGLLAGQGTTLPLLVRIRPAESVHTGELPPLNLALVIDRSGSMSGQPLRMAQEAAMTAVRQMGPGDRLSVVVFDDVAEVVVPSQLVTQPDALCSAIAGIETRGMTNLHAGWLTGATQVAEHLKPGALNRVVILSDGQTNAGVTRVDEIAQQVRGLNERGISTTAIGLGACYDEELLLAVANAGDGNFEHVEDPARLPTLFEEELRGLTRTTGRMVSLGVEPNPAHGVRVTDVLNAFDRNAWGRLQLPNLVAGQAVNVVVVLSVPAQAAGTTLGLTRARLAWTGPDGQRHHLRVQLNLPVLAPAAYGALRDDPEVVEAQTLLQAARLKRAAVEALDRGDQGLARQHLNSAYNAVMAAPISRLYQAQEGQDLVALSAALDAGDEALSRKRALSQAHARERSKRRD